MARIEDKNNVSRTPQQTVGPYVTLGLLSGSSVGMKDNDLTSEGGGGEEIIVQGNLFGSDGKPLFNVMVEIWQANSKGVFNHPSEEGEEGFDPHFIGFGRDITDEAGYYSFKTYKPGEISPTDKPEFSQSPNILMLVHASGVPHPMYTRVYFEDEEHDDNFLNQISEEEGKTLIAKKISDGSPSIYQFDMVIEGKADDLTLSTKLSGEELENIADGSGKPITYFFHFD